MASEEHHANTLTLEMTDAHGRLLAVRGGRETVRSPQTLVVVNPRLAFGRAAS
jgi:hypothetical protein